MNKKIVAVLTITAIVVSFGFIGSSYAFSSRDKGGHHEMKLSDKFFHKAHFLLMNEKELGLSEDQVQAIKDLKHETKKYYIMQAAKIDVIKVDIKSELYTYPIDVEAIDPLVDQKYDLKKAKAKYIIKAFADLKAVLSQEQYDKMKEIWYSQKR